MKIQPTNDRVLVQIKMAEEKTSSGIIMSGNPVPTSTAEVLGVGPDVKTIKVGDTIALSKRCGMEITVEGKQFIVIKENEIIAVIKD